MNRWSVGIALLLAVLGGGVVLRFLVAPTARSSRFEKSHIARLPLDARLGSFVSSPDGRRSLYVADRHGSAVAVMDGRVAGQFEQVSFPWVSSTRTPRIVFLGHDKTKRTSWVVDGLAVRVGLSRRDWQVFSADGQRSALLAGSVEAPAAAANARAMIALDGAVVGHYLDATVARFSPDGMHVGYLAVDLEGRRSEIRDGRVLRSFEPSTDPCAVELPWPAEGPSMVRQHDLRWSSDARTFLLTTDADGWAVYAGDQRLASYPANVPGRGAQLTVGLESPDCLARPAIGAGSLALASAAPVAAWWARVSSPTDGTAGLWHVVRDGTPVAPAACVRAWDEQPPALSPDGSRVAYPCVVWEFLPSQRVFVVHGDRWHGPYTAVWAVTFSPDGRRLFYLASSSDDDVSWQTYVDGRPNSAMYFRVYGPWFSPDGRHYAWLAQQTNGSRVTLIVDGRRISTFDELVGGPAWGADSVAWIVSRGRRIRRLAMALP